MFRKLFLLCGSTNAGQQAENCVEVGHRHRFCIRWTWQFIEGSLEKIAGGMNSLPSLHTTRNISAYNTKPWQICIIYTCSWSKWCRTINLSTQFQPASIFQKPRCLNPGWFASRVFNSHFLHLFLTSRLERSNAWFVRICRSWGAVRMHTKGPTKATRFIKTPAGGAAQVISFFFERKRGTEIYP